MRNQSGGTIAILIGAFLTTVPTAVLFLGVTYLFAVPLILGILTVGLGARACLSERADWLNRHILAVALVLMVLSFSPFGLIYYENLPGKPVHFVIPDGFGGPIALVADERQGADVPIIGGKHVYSIPADGILRVKDLEPFHQWHRASASFADGTAIPTPTSVGTIRLHDCSSGGMFSNGKEVHYILFFVGIKSRSLTEGDYISSANAAGDELLRRKVLRTE